MGLEELSRRMSKYYETNEKEIEYTPNKAKIPTFNKQSQLPAVNAVSQSNNPPSVQQPRGNALDIAKQVIAKQQPPRQMGVGFTPIPQNPYAKKVSALPYNPAALQNAQTIAQKPANSNAMYYTSAIKSGLGNAAAGLQNTYEVGKLSDIEKMAGQKTDFVKLGQNVSKDKSFGDNIATIGNNIATNLTAAGDRRLPTIIRRWLTKNFVFTDDAAKKAGYANKESMIDAVVNKALNADNWNDEIQQDYNELYEGKSGGQKVAGAILQAVSQMVPSIVSNAFLPGSGLPLMAGEVYGNSAMDALNQGATLQQAKNRAALTAATEVGTEKLFGGIPGLNKGLVKLGKFGDILGEGVEEGFSTAVSGAIDRATFDPNAEDASWGDIGLSAALGAGTAGIMNLPGIAVDAINDVRSGEAYRADPGENEAAARMAGQLDRVYGANKLEGKAVLGINADQTQKLPTVTRREQRALDALSQKTGVNIQIDDDIKGSNGYFDRNTNTLHISRNSNNAVYQVAAHEITHSFESNPDEWNQLYEIANANLSEDARSKLEYVLQKTGYTDAEMQSEVVSHYVQQCVTDIKSFEQLVGVNRTLAQRIVDAFESFVRKLTGQQSIGNNSDTESLREIMGDITPEQAQQTLAQMKKALAAGGQTVSEGIMQSKKLSDNGVDTKDSAYYHHGWAVELLTKSEMAAYMTKASMNEAGQEYMPQAGTGEYIIEFGHEDEPHNRIIFTDGAQFPSINRVIYIDGNGEAESVQDVLEGIIYGSLDCRTEEDVDGFLSLYEEAGLVRDFKRPSNDRSFQGGKNGGKFAGVYSENNKLQNRKRGGNSSESYSLKLSPDQITQNINTAVSHFGTTNRINEAGYLTVDGRLLDFSGKHDGAPGGYRTVDHRDIRDALGLDYGGDSYSGGMIQFMSEGNIRLAPESGGINLSVKPTEAQETRLKRYIQNFGGEVIVDFDNTNGDTVGSVEYPARTPASLILQEIRDYFDKGKMPENFDYSRKLNQEALQEMVDWKRAGLPYAPGYVPKQQPQQLPYAPSYKAAETLRLYHGTASGGNFDSFSEEFLGNSKLNHQLGQGFYFTDNKQEANSYLKNYNAASDSYSAGSNPYLHEVDVKIENPFVMGEMELPLDRMKTVFMEGDNKWFFDSHLPRILGNKEIAGVKRSTEQLKALSNEEKIDLLLSYESKFGDGRGILQYSLDAYRDQAKLLDSMRRNFGYDAIVDRTNKNTTQYVVFDPGKIAKATAANSPTQRTGRALPYNPNAPKPLPQNPAQGKFGGNTVGAAESNPDSYSALQNRHGTIKPGENPSRLVDVPKKDAEGNVVSLFSRTGMESEHMPDELVEPFEQAIASGEFSHVVWSDKHAKRYAEGEVNKGFEHAWKQWRAVADGTKVATKDDIALGELLLANAMKDKQIDLAIQLTAELCAEATRAGQNVQAFRLLKKMTPEGQLFYLQKVTDKLNNQYEGRKGFDGIKLNEDYVKELTEATTKEAMDKAVDKIKQDIADQTPVTFEDKWNAWRYLAMLGNVRTQVRNIMGNFVFLPVVKTKNLIATGIERAAGKRLPERTKALLNPKKDKALISYGKNDFENVKAEVSGGDKYTEQQDILSKRRIFRLENVERARVLTHDIMEWGDQIFSKGHYATSLAAYMKANNLTPDTITPEQLNKARNYAIKEAQKATFRDSNAFASFLNANKKNLAARSRNADTTLGKVGWKAAEAIAEGIVPFTKTPANIMARGVEYSPIGLFYNLLADGSKIKSGKMTAAEAIDKISAGLTGTALAGLGYFLASMGAVTGAAGDDKEDKYNAMLGEQEYALKLGDGSYKIDWLAPAALPFFTGVALFDTFGNSGKFEAAQIFDALSMIGEPMFELSMLQGINDALGASKYSDQAPVVSILSNAAFGYAGQAVPTSFGQVARAVDKTRRQTYYNPNYKGVVKEGLAVGQKQVAKIPFASKALQPSIDMWGREQENEGGSFVGRLAYNMLSPGYASTNKATAVDKELQSLYKKTGETSVLPSYAPKTFELPASDGGDKVKLNAKEYTQYAKDKGSKAYDIFDSLIGSKGYNSLSDEDKVEVASKVYEYANAVAKSNVSDYTLRDTAAKIQKCEKAGIPAGVAIVAYVAQKDVKGDKDSKGNTIQLSASKNKKEAIDRMTPFISKKQRELLYELFEVSEKVW